MMMILAFVAPAAAVDLTVEPATAPPGISAAWYLGSWSKRSCEMVVRLTNEGDTPVVIDWNMSVIATEAGASAGLVPGDASKMTSMTGIAPTVISPGGFVEQRVFRKDRLPTDDPPTACPVDRGATATVSLKLDVGWYIQDIHVSGPKRVRQLNINASGAHIRTGSEGRWTDYKLRGDEREVTTEMLRDDMSARGCAYDQFDHALSGWRTARITGNFTVWIFGAGLVGYAIAGANASVAEEQYNTCMMREIADG